MTPSILRSGPEAATAPRERGAETNANGDFAALFGALRRAEAPTVPAPTPAPTAPVAESPAAAAPAGESPTPTPVAKPLRHAPRAVRPATPASAPGLALSAALAEQPTALAVPTIHAAAADAAPEAAARSADEETTRGGEPAPGQAIASFASITAFAPPAAGPSATATMTATAAAQADAAGPSRTRAAPGPLEPVDAAAAGATEASRSAASAAGFVLPAATESPPAERQTAQTSQTAPEAQAAPSTPTVLLSAPPASTPAPLAAPALPAQATLGLPPQHAGFAEALGAQLSVWTRQGVQQAELRLNPAELGPVQVRIQIEGQLAQVSFVADAAATRDALQAALPELAAALAGDGLHLSGGSVQSQAERQQQQQQQQQQQLAGEPAGRAATGGSQAVAAPPLPRPVSQRLLDLYA